MQSQVTPSSAGERRVATVNLICVVGVAFLGALSLPARPLREITAATKLGLNRLVDAPQIVRVVDAPQKQDACAAQIWPYIEARCLARAPNNTAPPASAPPVSPPTAVTQVAPPASSPQIAAVEISSPAASSIAPNEARPSVKDSTDARLAAPIGTMTTDTAGLPRPAVSAPPPLGAEPRTRGEATEPAPPSSDAAKRAAIAGAAMAGLAVMGASTSAEPQAKPRAEGRRRVGHGSRSLRIFGFRIGGARF